MYFNCQLLLCCCAEISFVMSLQFFFYSLSKVGNRFKFCGLLFFDVIFRKSKVLDFLSVGFFFF